MEARHSTDAIAAFLSGDPDPDGGLHHALADQLPGLFDGAADLPFTGSTAWEIMVQKIEKQLQLGPLSAAVSPESVELIAAMLANEPEQRIGDYKELIERIHGPRYKADS